MTLTPATRPTDGTSGEDIVSHAWSPDGETKGVVQPGRKPAEMAA